ncbi:hypothetical protein Tco_0165359, partial [Tanacetum coccineum]
MEGADRRLSTLARHLQTSAAGHENATITCSPTSSSSSSGDHSIFANILPAPEDPILG